MCLQGIPSIEAGEHRVDFNRLHFAPTLDSDIVDILEKTPAGESTIIMLPNSKNEDEFDEYLREAGFSDIICFSKNGPDSVDRELVTGWLCVIAKK